MSEEKKAPQFDPHAIEFPTDRITLGQLRHRHPEYFGARADRKSIGNVDVFITQLFEQELAQKAFARAAGLPDPDPEPLTTRNETLLAINDEYRAYGLSEGIQRTRQLVKAFETAAANQGRSFRGQSR